ncbi:hypothetical protein KVA01_02980 [Kocuria varians]|uniref:Uncharacterized protein n=1 Tax=Kocuria varians TaxID=1272 RepID=A0A4Y4D3L2_KOCVA|nr:hypothetical protein KVA01_02980 [Kocuria varians]
MAGIPEVSRTGSGAPGPGIRTRVAPTPRTVGSGGTTRRLPERRPPADTMGWNLTHDREAAS